MTAAAEAPGILLRHHLKKLKLPTVLREYEKLARQCAAENVDHVRYLMRLIEPELPGGQRPPDVACARGRATARRAPSSGASATPASQRSRAWRASTSTPSPA